MINIFISCSNFLNSDCFTDSNFIFCYSVAINDFSITDFSFNDLDLAFNKCLFVFGCIVLRVF